MTAGTLRFTWTNIAGSATPSISNQFRYVIIPGAVSGSRITIGPAAGYTVEQVKSMSYEQIKALFNIPENGSNEK